jgi:precorrin-6B methylase 2
MNRAVYDLDRCYSEIEGWTHKEELWWLNHVAKSMENIVEIGCWKGRSSHALLSGCKGTVYCIDNFKGNPDERETTHKEAQEKDISIEFMENVGHFPNMKLFKMDSVEAASKFSDNSVDMVFIDGDHSYQAVYNDIMAWYPKCRKLLCGHDLNLDSVWKAIKDAGFGHLVTYNKEAGMRIWAVWATPELWQENIILVNGVPQKYTHMESGSPSEGRTFFMEDGSVVCA